MSMKDVTDMPKSTNQKLKILYLMKILLAKTDEKHVLSVPQMIELLAQHDIQAERKSIYDDLEALRLYGIDIECLKGKNGGYYVASRQFELPELKLLVDAVQSSKFITRKKSNELIKKLETFSSIYDAQLLQRQVHVANRIKTMNESIYYNIDNIHAGISAGKQISFLYFEYTVNKERSFRHNGTKYVISPYALTWDNENYYMIGYDDEAKKIKHYRVDKMMSIDVTELNRLGREEFEKFDMAAYSRKVFGMYGGEEENVKLRFQNHLAGVVIDRFGKDVFISKSDENHFDIDVGVQVSPQFLAWVFGLGGDVQILQPQSVKEQFKKMLENVKSLYE